MNRRRSACLDVEELWPVRAARVKFAGTEKMVQRKDLAVDMGWLAEGNYLRSAVGLEEGQAECQVVTAGVDAVVSEKAGGGSQRPGYPVDIGSDMAADSARM